MLVGTLVETWELINPFPILAMTGKDQRENMLVKALKCFSIYSNGKQILNTDTGKGHLNSLSGIRSISMCWIIYGHLYLIANSLSSQGYIENRMDVREVIHIDLAINFPIFAYKINIYFFIICSSVGVKVDGTMKS